MKNTLFLVALLFAMACNDNPASTPEQKLTDSTGMISQATPVDSLLPPANTIENNIEADSMEAVDSTPDIETYYVLVADTGMNYGALNATMYALSKKTALSVDTLGRYFNTKKNKIVLRDDDEDEVYAGEYFPRRFPSTSLSMEYMDNYTPGSKQGTMGIIAGIFEQAAEGEKALQVVKTHCVNARLVKADIYVGCIH